MTDDDGPEARWLPVVGHEGHYLVSDQGEVWSVPRLIRTSDGKLRRIGGQMLKPFIKKSGAFKNRRVARLQVPGGAKQARTIYSLVLTAFRGPRPEGLVARHLNGNCQDDRLDNLAWGTPSENNLDQVVHGVHRNSRKVRCIRGHLLVRPNLRLSGLRRGCRTCLACDRAKERARRLPWLDVREEADRLYAIIMQAADEASAVGQCRPVRYGAGERGKRATKTLGAEEEPAVAQRTVVQLVSDLTGEEIGDGEGETVRFGLDGVDYETDLFSDQAEELRELLAPYVAAGRRTGGRARRGTASKASSGSADRARNQRIREWARSQGLQVSDRGRISSELVEKYEASGAA